MKFRTLFLCAAATMLPLAAVQAPAPTTTQAAPAPAKKMTKKEKKAVAAAASATPATPAVSAAPAASASRPAAPTAPSRQASQPAPAPVAGGFIGNKDSKIVHRSDCKMAAKISAAHRVAFASAADAKAQGYKACKVCKPF